MTKLTGGSKVDVLNSCNSVVHSVSRNGIYGMRMLSPIGANSVIVPDLDKINIIKELLSVKFHKGQISLFCES